MIIHCDASGCRHRRRRFHRLHTFFSSSHSFRARMASDDVSTTNKCTPHSWVILWPRARQWHSFADSNANDKWSRCNNLNEHLKHFPTEMLKNNKSSGSAACRIISEASEVTNLKLRFDLRGVITGWTISMELDEHTKKKQFIFWMLNMERIRVKSEQWHLHCWRFTAVAHANLVCWPKWFSEIATMAQVGITLRKRNKFDIDDGEKN